MHTVITATISVAYGVVAIATARLLYGRLRTIAINESGRLDYMDDADYAIPVIFGTLLGGLLWPVAFIGMAVFMNPPKTDLELEAENEKLAAKIKRMERDAGLNERNPS